MTSGEYYWNGGMFLFRASRYLDELKKFSPDIYEICKTSLDDIKSDLDFLRLSGKIFEQCPSDSVDYAVMEKTKDAVVVPMDAGWSDVGSWSSLWDINVKDKSGNFSVGDVMLHESKDCFVRADSRLVSVVGAEGLVVIDTKDALMVAHKDSVEDVKIIANNLKDDERYEWESHREVYRLG